MRFWSEGLGDGELVMSLDRAKAVRKAEVVALSGVIEKPAPWEYEVKIELDDWKAILRIATGDQAIDFIAARAGWGQIARMAASILKFVVLLAGFRLRALLGGGGMVRSPAGVLEQPGAKER